MFSVGDVYAKLKSFSAGFRDASQPLREFYFVKADVQSCFDTIPQREVVQLMERLASEAEYRIDRHVEIRASEGTAGSAAVRPTRRFCAKAKPSKECTPFDQTVEGSLACGKKDMVFVGGMLPTYKSKQDLLLLLREHVEMNIVKIGKNFYRHKAGIPQGSVLSSLLCNFFYGDLEATRLGFLRDGENLLMRLIDDFLLITPNREHAQRFIEVMHRGVPEYGVSVNPAKTLTNFPVSIAGKTATRIVKGERFPYCGNFIDTRTLEISKDRARKGGSGMPTKSRTTTKPRLTRLQKSQTHSQSNIPTSRAKHSTARCSSTYIAIFLVPC